MKKLNFMVLLIMLSLPLMAQESAGAVKSSGVKGRLGFYGGVNFANINGDSDSYDEALTGYQLGVMYCVYSSGNIFSCWLEPGYNMIGSKYNDTYDAGSGTQNVNGSVNLGYIMVPVIARFQSPKGLFGDIGLQPQLLVSAKDKYDGNKDDYKDYVNSFDFGIPVGVGYEYKKKVGLSARYYMGLSNINKLDSDSKDHNSVFSLRLHVRL
jgi:hypothetical protein